MKLQVIKWFHILLFPTLIFLVSCEKEDGQDFIADFSIDFIDDNNVKFVNLSEGEYYSLDWDFGNGETATTTNKSKQYEVYYPEAGDYDARLSVLDYTGNTKIASKTVHISKSDLLLSFTAEVDPSNKNYVTLINTTEGNYDSFRWLYADKIVDSEPSVRAYFPFSGSYDIELEITKGAAIFSLEKTVVITQDDPDYVSNFTLVWSDEFDGNTVNTNNWKFETGAGGWGNNELQNYTNGSNAEVKDGKLIITAKKIDDNKVAGSYSSTRMITKGKKEFTYGKMEIRAKLPSGTGIWPAIWMLGGNIDNVGWPACGEIDIMEYVGYQPNTIHSTVHTAAGSGNNGDGSSKALETAEEDFHVYGLIWTQDELLFYTDSPENVTHTYNPSTKTEDNWPFDKPHFFILNIAVGGTWGGAQGIDNSIFPQTMEIDYVRVYQFPE